MLLSEPTGSLTRWDDNFEQPFITVCPHLPYSNIALRIMHCGSNEEKRGFYGNDTLLALFRREGLSLDEILLHGTYHVENISQDNDSFWRKKEPGRVNTTMQEVVYAAPSKLTSNFH